VKKGVLIGEIKLCQQLLNNELLPPQLAEQLKAKVAELQDKLEKSPVAARANL